MLIRGPLVYALLFASDFDRALPLTCFLTTRTLQIIQQEKVKLLQQCAALLAQPGTALLSNQPILVSDHSRSWWEGR
jgi:hypothetical protein